MSVHNIHKEKMLPGDVYIGRPGKGQDGFFGSPVRIGWPCPQCKVVHKTAGETLPCYRILLWKRIQEEDGFLQKLQELNGKRLFCFCKPGPCHGDVLTDAIRWALTQ